jgi:Family of unknown function (DUF6603)
VSDPFSLEADVALAEPLADAVDGGLSITAVRVDLSAGISLPGVSGRAQRFGVAAGVSFRFARDGNLAGRYLKIDMPAPFPPEVIGVELEGPLPGGGFLDHIPEIDTYRGAIGVDLGVVVVSGFASIRIGDPISIVAILAAEFRPPIQLSFGFTLVGVGGIVGINRRIDQGQIEIALGSGEITAMLFPNDPIGEADRILPALDRCFPVANGDFLAGPMLKLGWGTPTIVSATIAVLATSNGQVVILGRFALSLPCEDVPFAVISVTISGIIDADGVSINGSLVNSHIGPITIDGDAAFKMTGGDNGVMALSVGGFHPAYNPPPGIPPLRRLSAELSPLPFASLRYEGYVALTADSVQFGGGVRAKLDLEVAGIEGEASFDALIYFSPFRFTTDFRARLSLEILGEDIAGISLTAHFSGPGHWELSGECTVEILWWDVDVPIELSWGDAPPEPMADITPIEVLRAEVAKSENWLAESMGDVANWLTIAPSHPTEGASAVLSPLGALTFVQQALPLDREVTRIGGRRLPDKQTASVKINDATPNLDRQFPAGLFFDRTPAELLSGKALLPCHAGVTVQTLARDTGHDLTKDLDFEDFFLVPDEIGILRLDRRIKAVGLVKEFQPTVLEISLNAGAAARRFAATEQPIQVPAFALITIGGA